MIIFLLILCTVLTVSLVFLFWRSVIVVQKQDQEIARYKHVVLCQQKEMAGLLQEIAGLHMFKRLVQDPPPVARAM